MNEILSTAIALLILAAAFAGLVAWVRRDTLTAAQRSLPATDAAERDAQPARTSSPQTAPRTVRSRRTGTLQLN